MSEENKTPQESKNDQPAPTGQEPTSELEADESKKTEVVDYKAELEAERERRERAEDKIVKLKKDKQETPPAEIPQDAMEKLKQELLEVQQAELSKIRMESSRSVIEAEISKRSTSDDEAALIRYHLENSVKMSGDVAKDVARAKLLANEKHYQKGMQEMAEALKAKNATGAPGFGSETKDGKQKAKLAGADKAFANAFRQQNNLNK